MTSPSGDSAPARGRTWVVVIPNWAPPSKNEIRGTHYRREHKIKLATTQMIATYAFITGVPRLTDKNAAKRRVTLAVEYPNHASLPDPQNLCDIFYDALTNAQMIVDDSAKWLETEMPVVSVTLGVMRTTITIEELP